MGKFFDHGLNGSSFGRLLVVWLILGLSLPGGLTLAAPSLLMDGSFLTFFGQNWFNTALRFTVAIVHPLDRAQGDYRGLTYFFTQNVPLKWSDFRTNSLTWFYNMRSGVTHAWRQFLGLELSQPTVVTPTPSTVATDFGTTTNLFDIDLAQLKQEIYAELKKELDRQVKQSGTLSGSVSNYRGIVVFPTSGSVEADAAKKKEVEDAFSDQVIVQFDYASQSGVVRPVFKNRSGNNYIFVLTPIQK